MEKDIHCFATRGRWWKSHFDYDSIIHTPALFLRVIGWYIYTHIYTNIIVLFFFVLFLRPTHGSLFQSNVDRKRGNELCKKCPVSKYVSRHSAWVIAIGMPRYLFSFLPWLFILDCILSTIGFIDHERLIMSKMPFSSLLAPRSKTDYARQLRDYFSVIENEQDKEKRNYEDVSAVRRSNSVLQRVCF